MRSLCCAALRGAPTYDRPAGVRGGGVGAASIRDAGTDGIKRVLEFDGGEVTSPVGGDLRRGRQADNGLNGIDNREFYVVPDAVVVGGWADPFSNACRCPGRREQTGD